MLSYTVVVTAPQLWQPNHSDGHRELVNLALQLRNQSGFGFARIAEELNSTGRLSPRGKRFYSALVHSIYWKWTLRRDREARHVDVCLKEVCLILNGS
jgi:hypothetical protein